MLTLIPDHFDHMMINGEKVPVQNGTVFPYETYTMLVLGNAPKEDTLSKKRLDVTMDTILIRNLELNLEEQFDFTIETKEGNVFSGKADVIVSNVHETKRGRVIEHPIFLVSSF